MSADGKTKLKLMGKREAATLLKSKQHLYNNLT